MSDLLKIIVSKSPKTTSFSLLGIFDVYIYDHMSYFYILYKIVNNINNKFYIGVHKTKDIHDEYFGSGHLIKAAIKKYGIENFSKTILQIYTNKEDAFRQERLLVTESLVKDDCCYNLKEGGHGGFDHIRAKGLHRFNKGKKIIHNPLTNQQIAVSPEGLETYLANGWKLGFRESALQKMSDSGKLKIQSEEHRKKNSESKKGAFLFKNLKTGKHKYVKKENAGQFLKEDWILIPRGRPKPKN